ncbi:MAG: hypothetical protein ACPMAG_11940 [Limisphaerales bacterium]
MIGKIRTNELLYEIKSSEIFNCRVLSHRDDEGEVCVLARLRWEWWGNPGEWNNI